MPSRTTLHLPDGRSLPVSRSALGDALPGLPDGESLRLETHTGAWMTATRMGGGFVLSYRLLERMARYESPQVSEDVAADVLLDFAEAGSSWPSALAWREVEAAPEPVSLRDVTYDDARAGGRNALVRYALTRWYGSLILLGPAFLALKFHREWIAMGLMGLGFGYVVVEALLTGELQLAPTIRRESNPWIFFYFVSMFGVMSSLCLIGVFIS